MTMMVLNIQITCLKYFLTLSHTHTKQIAFSKSQDAYLYQEKGYQAS